MEALASQQAQLAGSNERQAALRSAFVDLHGTCVRKLNRHSSLCSELLC